MVYQLNRCWLTHHREQARSYKGIGAEAVAQDRNLPNGLLFVVKLRAGGEAFGRIRGAVVGPASATAVFA